LATDKPSFMQFLAQALRQRSLSPQPEDFAEFDKANAPKTEFEQMKEGIERRKKMLES